MHVIDLGLASQNITTNYYVSLLMRLFLFKLLSDPGNSIHAKALRNQILSGEHVIQTLLEISNAFDALNLVNSIKALKLVKFFSRTFSQYDLYIQETIALFE